LCRIIEFILYFQFAPFILTPSSFPRKEFEKALELQPILNELMHAVAYDVEFLTTTLASTIKVDEFTRNLFQIYEKVLAEGMTQVFINFLYHLLS
jgi:glutathione synthase